VPDYNHRTEQKVSQPFELKLNQNLLQSNMPANDEQDEGLDEGLE